MDKYKLIQIVLKDLDELKLLTEEVSEFEVDSSLIIDLALSKARLLCQEIELLHEYSDPPAINTEDDNDDFNDSDENEFTDLPISDPELEIIDFEQDDSSEDSEIHVDEESEELVLEEETEELDEEEIDSVSEKEAVDIEDEDIEDETSDIEEENFTEVEEVQEEETIEDATEDYESIEVDEEDIEEEIIANSEVEEEVDDRELEEDEDVVYNSDEDEDDEITEEETEDHVDEDIEESEIQIDELKHDPQPGVREIFIDDLDDDDLDNFKISPAESSSRPIMREIPKPAASFQEELLKEKQLSEEKFQKGRSLNDAIGESKSTESKLSSGPISSLRSAIGLNDRFLFIREIFENNTEKYNTVIDQLDKLETIQEAVDYLKVNLSLQKNDTSLKFVDLLKRRFSK